MQKSHGASGYCIEQYKYRIIPSLQKGLLGSTELIKFQWEYEEICLSESLSTTDHRRHLTRKLLCHILTYTHTYLWTHGYANQVQRLNIHSTIFFFMVNLNLMLHEKLCLCNNMFKQSTEDTLLCY